MERAIARAGSEAKLADAIGYSQAAINRAKHRQAGPAMSLKIEHWSGGEIPARELRPDLPWPEAEKQPETESAPS